MVNKISKLSLIVAYNKHKAIGKGNELMWKVSNDLKLVKELTTNNAILMGRKTFESLGKPLPNRVNIVLTRDKDYGNKHEGIKVIHTKEDVFKLQETLGVDVIYIFGGQEIYEMFIEDVNEMRITEVDNNEQGDAYFPKINNVEWCIELIKECGVSKGNDYSHRFYKYTKGENKKY